MACRYIRAHNREGIPHATGLIEDGEGESLAAVSAEDALATLNLLEIVLQYTRDAKRRGEARMENTPK